MILLNRFYGRLALALFVLLTAVGLGMLAVTHHFNARYQQEVTQKLNHDLARHIVSETMLMRDGRVDKKALKEIFHMMLVINPGIELYLLGLDGTLLGYSAPPAKLQKMAVDMAPIREFISEGSRPVVLGENPRDATGRVIFSVAPIPGEHGVQGYLYIILANEEATNLVQGLEKSYVQRAGAWTIGLAMLTAFLAGLYVLFRLTYRLRRLTAEVVGFKQQTAPAFYPPVAPSSDDIAQLQGSFREMAHRIEAQIQEMRQADGLRRERVAQMSHDLRTSLTALHGYLETLKLKADRLSQSEHQVFLDTALRHSERLARLISDFFELAKLEHRDVVPARERFALVELIQDVVLKFQPLADARGVHLEWNAGGGAYQVEADIGMIERVLSNLIANALKFTLVGGRVSVRIEREAGEVKVIIADTGVGIAPKDLSVLLGDTSSPVIHRDAHPDSSGLGLAIVKQVLALHGARLRGESVVDQGTTFSFALPVVASSRVEVPVMEM